MGVKHRTSVGVSEVVSTRKYKSPTHQQTYQDETDTYILNLEQQINSLRESLKKQKDESKQMKRINKELLEELNLK